MKPKQPRGLREALSVAAVLALITVAVTVVLAMKRHSGPSSVAAPSAPSRICGEPVLKSPYSYGGPPGTFSATDAPAGLPTFGHPGADFPAMTKIVVIAPGDNTEAAASGAYQEDHTVFYFEPGAHRITSVMFTGHDSIYIGGHSSTGGKAVIDGVDGGTGGTGKGGSYLSSSKASRRGVTNNTWEYLTILNYAASRNDAVMGDVNGGGLGIGDTYKYNTIGPNEYGWRGADAVPGKGKSSGGGYAINMGDDTTVQYNCLTHNAQGAFNGGGDNIDISNNEISWNGLGEYPDQGGAGGSPYACGCSGGGKLNFSTNATISRNYVHDNYNAGIWMDFNNTGAEISFNYIESNWGAGIEYEASYNAHITYNTLVGNGWASNGSWPEGVAGASCFGGVSCTEGLGPVTGRGGGNPYAAIYLPNSGGNSDLSSVEAADGTTVRARYAGEILVEGNALTNNFGGVSVYSDTDRYPDGINNNSACSVPLGAHSAIYYRQTRVLQLEGATISGSSVSSPSGTQTYCSSYDSGDQSDGHQEIVAKTPAVGMGVYNLDAGTFLGNIAAAVSPKAFTLDRSPGDVTEARLLLSAYGGCGPADYFGGAKGKATGHPSAKYWDNCIWGSRNVSVTANIFVMQADHVTGCTSANRCGYMKIEAFNAGVPRLVQYFHAYPELVARASAGLNNVWSDNAYSWSGGGPGTWQFRAGQQGNKISLTAWQAPPFEQDAGSSFNGHPAAAAR